MKKTVKLSLTLVASLACLAGCTGTKTSVASTVASTPASDSVAPSVVASPSASASASASASTSTSVADETPEIDDSMFTDIGGKNITLTTDLTYGCPEMGSAMPYHMVTEFADGLFVDTGTWDYYDESFKEYKGDHQYRYFRDDKGKLAYTNPANKNNVIIQGEETDNGETLDFDDTIFQNLLGSLISADFEYSYTTASKEQIFTMTDTAKAGTHATYDNIFNAIGCVNAFSSAGAWGGPVALKEAYVRVNPKTDGIIGFGGTYEETVDLTDYGLPLVHEDTIFDTAISNIGTTALTIDDVKYQPYTVPTADAAKFTAFDTAMTAIKQNNYKVTTAVTIDGADAPYQTDEMYFTATGWSGKESVTTTETMSEEKVTKTYIGTDKATTPNGFALVLNADDKTGTLYDEDNNVVLTFTYTATAADTTTYGEGFVTFTGKNAAGTAVAGAIKIGDDDTIEIVYNKGATGEEDITVTPSGVVTTDKTTIAYTSTEDAYFGVHANGDGTYDRYSGSSATALKGGYAAYKASAFAPAFNFSTAVFDYDADDSSDTEYVFTVKQAFDDLYDCSAIAKEMTADSFAKQADDLKVYVTSDGVLEKFEFTFSDSDGNTNTFVDTFDKIGAVTDIPTDIADFTAYTKLAIPTDFSATVTDSTTETSMTATAALTAIFGADSAAKIPFPVIAATKPYYLGMAYWSKTKTFRVAFVTDGDVYNIIDNFTKIVTALQGDGYTLTMTGDAEAEGTVTADSSVAVDIYAQTNGAIYMEFTKAA